MQQEVVYNEWIDAAGSGVQSGLMQQEVVYNEWIDAAGSGVQ